MAARTPLVIVNGIVSQLPAGDILSTELLAIANGASYGQAIYITSLGAAALADSTSHPETVGLSFDSNNVQIGGIFTATTGQWTALTGGPLVAGSVYFLGVAGNLTVVIPTSPGSFLVRIGKALSPTELELAIEPPIGL